MSERKAMRYRQYLLIYSLKIREVSVLKTDLVTGRWAKFASGRTTGVTRGKVILTVLDVC